ncbi:MAG TPA: cupin domain-containing protein [Solirubrobacterales bacterium]|jgi:uncharacterized cupin superfamily protein|nr:cupin domain-containing protein [Solirubrobacterales bacterium]
MTNIGDLEFDESDGPAGFRARRTRLGLELGSELIGASLWKLPPGEAAYPHHFHYSDEEIVIVLSGRPSLRAPDGVRELSEGDAIGFPLGEEGAHQIFNATEEEATFLALSRSGRPDIVVYPDTGKISVSERQPDGSGLRAIFNHGEEVGFLEGRPLPKTASSNAARRIEPHRRGSY